MSPGLGMEEPPSRNRGGNNRFQRATSTATATATETSTATTTTTTTSKKKGRSFAATATAIDGGSFRGELSRLLYRPLPRSDRKAIESSLSVIPWKLLLIGDDNDNDEKFSSSSINGNTNATVASHTQGATNNENDKGFPPGPAAAGGAALQPTQSLHSSRDRNFPSISYLDLRRNQNVHFAKDRCRIAGEKLEAGNHDAARASWKQALELVPDHLPSLVGYGAFLAETGRIGHAQTILEKALAIDPGNSTAERLLLELSEIRTRQRLGLSRPYSKNHQAFDPTTNNNKISLSARESSAYQDALLERKLMASDSPEQQQQQQGDDPSAREEHESTDDDTQNRSKTNHSRKKEDRHWKSFKHKHRYKDKDKYKHKSSEKKEDRHKRRKRKEDQNYRRRRRSRHSQHASESERSPPGDDSDHSGDSSSSFSSTGASVRKQISDNGHDDEESRGSSPKRHHRAQRRRRKRRRHERSHKRSRKESSGRRRKHHHRDQEKPQKRIKHADESSVDS